MKFEQHFLDEIRQRLPISQVVGEHVIWDKRKSQPQRGDMWACCPFHGEKSPSFHADDRRGIYHCLAAETRVITWNGAKPISQLAGSIARVLTRGGKWVDARFDSYGVQPLFTIEISRNGVKKSIRATSGHRWFVRGCAVEKTTADLKPGMRLEAALPTAPTRWAVDPDGLRHGIVFGDGTRMGKKSRAYLCGNKIADLIHLFDGFKTYQYPERHVIDGLPLAYCALPSLDAPPDYLRGFISGLLATDGHVAKDGTVILNQRDTHVLEFVRSAMQRLGIPTFPITTQIRLGINRVNGPISRIHISTKALPIAALIRPGQRERYARNRKKFERWRWMVRSVSATPTAIEEVFCASVPDEHAFALEDNILTGNCFGCGVSGDHFKFLTEKVGYTFPLAVERLANMAGIPMPEEVRQETAEQRARREAKVEADRKAYAERREQIEAEQVRAREVRVATAQEVIAETQHLAGTQGDAYLQARGIPPVSEWPWDPGQTIRFHPSLPYELDRSLGNFAAIVARVEDAWSETVAIWRIFLAIGKPAKAPVDNPKVGLGPAKGGAVRIGGVGQKIGIGEGLETCLAAWALEGFRYPVWAGLSTSGVAAFEPPLDVKRVNIFPDGDAGKLHDGVIYDPPGMRAARALRDRLNPTGIKTVISDMCISGDALDLLLTKRAYEERTEQP